MADPTIQTFCCHRGRFNADMAIQVMDQFNAHSYNLLCLCSSIVGICGALYQVLPRDEIVYDSRPHRVSNSRGRQIIIWLAIADLFASLGVFVRSIVWLNFRSIMPVDDDTADVLFCAFTSAWTQYFYMVTWLWTLCFAIDTYMLLKEKDPCTTFYHVLCWGLPAILTITALSILYIPNANCHNLSSIEIAFTRVLPNYCATYIPIAVVMIANPIIYYFSSKDMESLMYRNTSQLTSKERFIIDSLKCKFSLINVVFYLCWTPNLINGILLWTLWFNLPIKVIITIWYIMALLNPLQALLNAVVYRRWTPGAQKCSFCPNINIFKRRRDEEVHTPLLRRQPSRLHLTDSMEPNIPSRRTAAF